MSGGSRILFLHFVASKASLICTEGSLAWPVVRDPSCGVCAKIISCRRNRGRNGLSSSLESSSRGMSASGYPRTHSLPYCGAKLESRRHHAPGVQQLFLFHGMIGAQIFYLHTHKLEQKVITCQKISLLFQQACQIRGGPVHPTEGMQRRRESHQRAGERRQSCETTVVSTPDQRNGTERVERASLRPNFPQTGQLPRSIFLPFRERQRPSDTCRHGGVVSTSVPCPPEVWCTRFRRPWQPLAVPSAARAQRTVMSTAN